MSTYRTLRRLDFQISNVIGQTHSMESPRAYEGAGTGRRTVSWYSPAGGPNALLSADLPSLSRRSRAVYRNNPFIKQGIQRHVSQEVGTHIKPLFEYDNEAITEGLKNNWQKFVHTADADGIFSLYGLFALASLTRRISGECFIRIRPRRTSSGLTVPFQLQLLEPELIPISMNEKRGNNDVLHGIEFNNKGQRVAYHVYTHHPHEYHNNSIAPTTVRVPAALMMHHYLPTRPGQLRGEPETTQSLVSAFDHHEYTQAELVRKKSKAAHTAVIKKDMFENDWQYDPMSGEALTDTVDTSTEASNSDNASQIEAGMYNVLLPGEDIVFPDGDNTGSGYSDFQRWQLTGMAAGLVQPYQIFSGDLQGINDRLWRAITNEYFRWLDAWREHGIYHQVCRPVKNYFVDVCWLADLVDMPDYEQQREDYQKVTWQPQSRPYINRLQDVQADLLEINAGITTRDNIIVERKGRTAEDVDKENAAAKQRENNLGVSYNGDSEVTE